MEDDSPTSPEPAAAEPPRAKPPLWLEELGWAETYEVLELAGWGGAGRVYKAWHRGLRSCVALKIIDPTRVDDPRQLARFETEARTLAQLQEPVPHPNIVRVIDFKLTPTVGCLVMAYVPGPNLRSWCLRQKLDFRQRAALLAKASRAVGFMHRNGVVHRDLKPSNILVHEDTHEPVIVDLGVVKTHSDLTLTLPDQAVGTMHYMAPEQLASGRRETHASADVYALGTILYELMTGTLPHPGTITEIAQRHQQEVAPARPSTLAKALPRDLEIICLKALAHRAHERYATAGALADDLDRYLRGDRIHARSRSFTSIVWRQVRRHPALAAALAACVVLGGFALAKTRTIQREREATRLEQGINAALMAKPWEINELARLENGIAQLSHLSPGRAGELRVLLRNTAFQGIRNYLNQPRLDPADVDRVEESIAWCGRQYDVHGRMLSDMLAERLTRWETMLDLHPPFADAPGFFADPSSISVSAEALTPVYPDPATKTPRIALAARHGSHVEMSATFLPQAPDISHAGFCTTVGDTRYYFRLCANRQVKSRILGALVDRDRTDRTAVLCIMREDVVLRAQSVFIPEVLGKPVHLAARMEGGRLMLELNGSERIEFDDVFAPVGPVQLALDWVPDAHLGGLTVRAKSLPLRATPLEEGDNLAAHQQWADAQRLFAVMTSDPLFGAEAAFKIAMCEQAQGNDADAAARWQKLMTGPPSKWREMASLNLWKHHALAGRLDLARPCFEKLSVTDALDSSFRRTVVQGEVDELARAYRNTARGLNALRPNPDVEVAVRVHQFLGFTPLDTAVRFGIARHCNGTDDAARSLFNDALSTVRIKELAGRQRADAILCLNLWSWMQKQEDEFWLASVIDHWRKSLPPDDPTALFLMLEQARQLARSGESDAALKLADKIRKAASTDDSTRTSAILLEAALYLPDRPDNAARLLRSHAVALEPEPRALAIPVLCDRNVLLSAAHAWTPGSIADSVAKMIASGHSGSIAATLQSQFASAFLEDPAFLTAVNTLFDDEPGRALLRDYALRSKPARELIRETARLLSRSYLANSAFDSPLAGESMTRVDHLVNLMLQDFATGRFSESDLFLLMQNLRNPQLRPFLGSAMARWNEPLQREVTWLLDHRLKQATIAEKAAGS